MTNSENQPSINSKQIILYTLIFVIILSFVVIFAYRIQPTPKNAKYSIPIASGQYYTKSFSFIENDSLIISYQNQNPNSVMFAVLKNSQYNAWLYLDTPFQSIVFDYLSYEKSVTNVSVLIQTTDEYTILIANIRRNGSVFVNNLATTMVYDIQHTSESNTQKLDLGSVFSTDKGKLIYDTALIIELSLLTVACPIIIFLLENNRHSRSMASMDTSELEKVWESPRVVHLRNVFFFFLVSLGYLVYVIFMVLRNYVDLIALDMIFFVSVSNLVISFRFISWTNIVTKLYYFAMSGALFGVMMLLNRLNIIVSSITGFPSLIMEYFFPKNSDYILTEAINVFVSLFVLTSFVFLYFLYSILYKEKNYIDYKNRIVVQEFSVSKLSKLRKIHLLDNITKGEVSITTSYQITSFRNIANLKSKKKIFFSLYFYDVENKFRIMQGNQKDIYLLAYHIMENTSIPFEEIKDDFFDSKKNLTKNRILEIYPDF